MKDLTQKFLLMLIGTAEANGHRFTADQVVDALMSEWFSDTNTPELRRFLLGRVTTAMATMDSPTFA